MARIFVSGSRSMALTLVGVSKIGLLGLLYLFIVALYGFRLLQVVYLWRGGWPAASPFHAPVNDFGLFWAAGAMALHTGAASVYEPSLFSAAVSAISHSHITNLGWYYPPQSLVLAIPLAALPPFLAFCIWTVGIPVLGGLAMWRAGIPLWIAVSTFFSPAVLVCASLGQRGAFVGYFGAAAATAIFSNRSRWAALLGILIIKPAAMLFVPLVMLARRQWKALAYACLSALGLTMATVALFGLHPFMNYWHDTRPLIDGLIDGSYLNANGQNTSSIYWMLRSFGGTVQNSLIVQFIFTLLLTAALSIATWRDAIGPKLLAALALILSPIAIPYCYNYDLVGYEIGVALAVVAAERPITAMDALFWMAPGLSPLLAYCLGCNPMPVIIVSAAVHVVRASGGIGLQARSRIVRQRLSAVQAPAGSRRLPSGHPSGKPSAFRV